MHDVMNFDGACMDCIQLSGTWLAVVSVSSCVAEVYLGTCIRSKVRAWVDLSIAAHAVTDRDFVCICWFLAGDVIVTQESGRFS